MKEIDHNFTFMLFQTAMSLSLYTKGDIVQNVHAAFYTTCPLFLQKKDLIWNNTRENKVNGTIKELKRFSFSKYTCMNI